VVGWARCGPLVDFQVPNADRLTMQPFPSPVPQSWARNSPTRFTLNSMDSARTFASRIYEDYAPNVHATARPVRLEVTGRD